MIPPNFLLSDHLEEEYPNLNYSSQLDNYFQEQQEGLIICPWGGCCTKYQKEVEEQILAVCSIIIQQGELYAQEERKYNFPAALVYRFFNLTFSNY